MNVWVLSAIIQDESSTDQHTRVPSCVKHTSNTRDSHRARTNAALYRDCGQRQCVSTRFFFVVDLVPISHAVQRVLRSETLVLQW
jgi:hypothetical protein